MMDKLSFLSLVSEQARLGYLSEAELIAAYRQGLRAEPQHSTSSWLAKIFFGLGGLIIAVGICILLANFWPSFNTVTRLLLTLGVTIAAYLMAIIFDDNPSLRALSTPFFIVFALFLPSGLLVSFAEAHLFLTDKATLLVTSMICLILYRLSYQLYRHPALIIFALIYEFIWWMSVIYFIGAEHWLNGRWHPYAYASIILGLIELWRHRKYLNQSHVGLAKFVAFCGSLLILIPALILRDKTNMGHEPWEILCPLLLIGSFALAARWKERSLIFVSTLMLVIYFCAITSDYFANSMGWPIALVLLGFIIIASVYGAIRFNKKYL